MLNLVNTFHLFSEMPKARNKIIAGVASVVGASIISWRTFFPWIGYDLRLMKVGKRVGNIMQQDIAAGRWPIVMFEEAVAKYPKKAFVIFEDRIYTYEYMDAQSNKVANIALQWGLKAGDTVAIMMQNEPAFIWVFLGKSIGQDQGRSQRLYHVEAHKKYWRIKRYMAFSDSE